MPTKGLKAVHICSLSKSAGANAADSRRETINPVDDRMSIKI